MIQKRKSSNSGFSLVELTIVVIVLGVLSTFAVPRFLQAVERTKAAEAFAYLAEVSSSQARYNAQHGEYASVLLDLDVVLRTPNNFAVGAPSSANYEIEWEVTLTRTGASSGYGPYTVIFDQDGFNPATSTIPTELQVFN